MTALWLSNRITEDSWGTDQGASYDAWLSNRIGTHTLIAASADDQSKSDSDTFGFSETADLVVALSGSDTFGFSESATVSARYSESDAFVLSDSAQVAAHVSGTDTFTLTDNASMVAAISATENIGFSESVALVVALTAGETYSLIESADVHEPSTDMPAVICAQWDMWLSNRHAVGCLAIDAPDAWLSKRIELAVAVPTVVLNSTVRTATDVFEFSESAQVTINSRGIVSWIALDTQPTITDNSVEDTDTFEFSESATVTVHVDGTDTFSLLEQSSVTVEEETNVVSVSAQDTFGFSESATVTVHVDGDDTFTMMETSSLVAAVNGTDTFRMTERVQNPKVGGGGSNKRKIGLGSRTGL